MIPVGKRIHGIVIDYRSVIGDYAYPYILERMKIRKADFPDILALLQFGQYIGVDHLQPGIHFLSLELLFTVILKHDKTTHKKYGVTKQPQEEPSWICKPIRQICSHNRDE